MRRVPIYLLIDTSETMAGEPIESVKVGIEAMITSLRQDPSAIEATNISIITYNREAEVLLPLTPLEDVPIPEITCSGSCHINMSAAMKTLRKQIDTEVQRSTPTQKGDFRSYLVLTIAGEPSSWDSEIEKIFIESMKRFAVIVCYIEPSASEFPINDLFLDSCRVGRSKNEIESFFKVLPAFIDQFQHAYAIGDGPVKLNDLLKIANKQI